MPPFYWRCEIARQAGVMPLPPDLLHNLFLLRTHIPCRMTLYYYGEGKHFDSPLPAPRSYLAIPLARCLQDKEGSHERTAGMCITSLVDPQEGVLV